MGKVAVARRTGLVTLATDVTNMVSIQSNMADNDNHFLNSSPSKRFKPDSELLLANSNALIDNRITHTESGINPDVTKKSDGENFIIILSWVWCTIENGRPCFAHLARGGVSCNNNMTSTCVDVRLT